MACVFVAAIAARAQAQPGATPPTVTVRLTADEESLIRHGEITPMAHIGGAVGSFFGLGIGHAIQGRWAERGWIFTFGELATFAMIAVASSESDLDTRTVNVLAIVGWGGFLGLHGWEIADSITGPAAHNRRVRAARLKAAIAPAPSGSGAIAGVALRF